MAGRSCASVLLVARLTTASRSSGGKAPGPTGAGGVLQAGEAGGDEALAPLADGVPVAVQLRGDLLVVRAVGVGSAQEEPAAKGQGLRGGAGAGEGLGARWMTSYGGCGRGGRSSRIRSRCGAGASATVEGDPA